MKQISDKLWISPQLSGDDIEAAASKGITAIINNRPDGEEPGQPDAAANRAAADRAGLDYVHIPVVPGRVDETQMRAFQQALNAAPGPVLAHCKTGTRSLVLWSIGEVLDGRMRPGDLDDLSARTGIDLTSARKWLEAKR